MTPRRTILLVGAIVAVTLVLLLLGNGSPMMAFAPLAVVLFLVAIWNIPVRISVLGLLAIGLMADVPNERPAAGLWESPLAPIGALLFDNLNNVVGVSALRFSGLDALIVLLGIVIFVRSAGRTDGRERGANVLLFSLLMSFGAVVWLELYGLARGGDFRNSLWQLRPILWLPVLAAMIARALRGPEDMRLLTRIVVIAACVKTAFGLYFLFRIARPLGEVPPYVTTHSDTVLFTGAIAACIATCVHRPTIRNLVTGALASAWILGGIAANNRRIAFVALFVSAALVYLMLPRTRFKRFLTRSMILAAPLLVMYIAVGRHQSGRAFAPANSIWSVLTQKDASSGTRDIENFNLIMTLRANPIVGSGLGHEYREISKAYDISQAFAQYRFIGHNSVLWLWSVAGLTGFTAIWLTLGVTVFLAQRAYLFARTVDERTAAMWPITIIAIYMIQAWGDMGMHGWTVDLVLAPAIALTSRVAVSTGAWPSGIHLLRSARSAFSSGGSTRSRTV